LLILTAALAVWVTAGCARRGDPVSSDGDTGFRVVATLPIVGYADDVYVAGTLGLVAAGQGGLVVVDLTDPLAPVELGVASTSFDVTACSYSPGDSIAFVTDGPNGALAFDLSDPTAPLRMETFQSTRGRDVASVEVKPDSLHNVFTADADGGLRIWELRYYPQYQSWFSGEVRHIYTSGDARGLTLHGDLVLVATEQTGLAVCDASDLGSTTIVGTVDTPGNARAVCAYGDHAFVADGLRGLQVVDISAPSAPAVVASLETPGYADDIAYHDGRVYVADQDEGLRVIDVSDPLAPVLVGRGETPYASGVFVAGSTIYVADRDWGLVVIEED
jgi:hypothetical protein